MRGPTCVFWVGLTHFSPQVGAYISTDGVAAQMSDIIAHSGADKLAVFGGIRPIVTLEERLLNMIRNLV
jgi:hypothetical protein